MSRYDPDSPFIVFLVWVGAITILALVVLGLSRVIDLVMP